MKNAVGREIPDSLLVNGKYIQKASPPPHQAV